MPYGVREALGCAWLSLVCGFTLTLVILAAPLHPAGGEYKYANGTVVAAPDAPAAASCAGKGASAGLCGADARRRLVVYGAQSRVELPCADRTDITDSVVQIVIEFPSGAVVGIGSGYVYADRSVVTSAFNMYRSANSTVPGYLTDDPRFKVYVAVGTCNGTHGTRHAVAAQYVPYAFQACVADTLCSRNYAYALLHVPTLRAAAYPPSVPADGNVAGVADGTFGTEGCIAGFPGIPTSGDTARFYYQRGALQRVAWLTNGFLTSEIDITFGDNGAPCAVRTASGYAVAGIARSSIAHDSGQWNDCLAFDPALLGRMKAFAEQHAGE